MGERDSRYVYVNSRNHNRKIIRSGSSVTTQLLGILAPTVAPTGAGGTGTTFFYRYVYVNHFFTDPLALEPTDPFIRSNASPVSAAIASATTPPTITGTVSTDPQVTHLWLYVCDTVDGIFVRLASGYEVSNTGTPTWTGTTTVPTGGIVLEIDNDVPDTCRMVAESNGFFNYAGFIPITGNGSTNIGDSTVTVTTGTMFDGIVALFFQFNGDTTGGPDNTGIFIVQFVDSTHISFVNVDGSVDTYDGPSNKTAAPFRIWRDPSVIQISKRYNPDSIPGVVDPDFLILGAGAVSGIAKPMTGFALRYHYNNNGRKSVEICDFTQGIPPRRYPTSSPYAMANPRAYTTVGGKILYYDNNAGVIEDKGSVHVAVTQSVIPNLIKSLNKSSGSISEMEYDESRNLVFLAVAPSGFANNYYMIVYNLTTNTWNLWFMVPDVFSMRRIADSDDNVFIYMGSSKGSITKWPSDGFNEAVGNSIFGQITDLDDATHLTDSNAPFPVTGDKLIDRWVMTWNDGDQFPVYQFARVSDNTDTQLTLDTFIGPNSTTAFDPIPAVGDSYWMGPIQCLLGPNWDFNAIPDEDGKIYDVAVTTSGLTTAQEMKLELYRNFEPDPTMGSALFKNTYNDGTNDPDHQSWKSGVKSLETTGVSGWKITDNNEAPLTIKAVIKRIQAISETLNNRKGG